MSNNPQLKLKRAISVVAIVALVIQGFLPSGFIGSSPARAASNTWHFTTPGNYTLGTNVTLMDTYTILDLGFIASDDGMDDYGATTDLVETNTNGRILAAVATDGKLPFSTDYGQNWTLPINNYNGTHIDLAKYPAGTYSGRILAGGISGGGNNIIRYTIDEGAEWSDALSLVGATRTGAVGCNGNVGFAGTGPGAGDNDGKIYYSTNGGDVWNAASSLPTTIVQVHNFLAYGSRTYAAVGLVAGSSTSTGIFYSDDDGDTWSHATTTSGDVVDATLALTQDSSGYIYATTSRNTIFKSTTAGGTAFSRITASGTANAEAIYATSTGPEIIVIGETTIIRSPDGGTNFATQTTTVPNATDSHALIRMSNYEYLLAVEQTGSTGDAYIGKFSPLDGETPTDTVVNNTGVAFSEVTAFSDAYATSSEGTNIKYQISNNGSTWYYYNAGGGSWSEGTLLDESNTASVINTNIASFDNDVGIGTFYFKAIVDQPTTLTYATDKDRNSVNLDSITIEYTAPTITVIAPNGDEDWSVGSTYDITWTSEGLGGGDIIDIDYTIEGESSQNIVENTANDGTYGWQIPNTPDSQIKVTISSGAIEDLSDAYFTISVPGGGGDGTKPVSSVNSLPQYTAGTEFTVNVTAADNAGVSLAKLYYSDKNEITHRLWGTDDSAPFSFTFDTTNSAAWGDGRYNFYACAEDFSNNSDCADKNLPFSEGTLPTIEAYTIVDSSPPYITNTAPSNLQTQIGADQPIVLNFSEPINTSTFAYQFHQTLSEQSITDTSIAWSNGDKQATIQHPTLEHYTWHTFKVASAQDVAGNTIQDGTVPSEWYFKTILKIDPDLTNSTISADAGPNEDGTYNLGDTVQYTIVITNVSDLPASNTTATLALAQYLTYKTGSASASSGTITLQQQGGQITGLDWHGAVIQDTDVTITFQAVIATVVNSIQIQQPVTIFDNVNFNYFPAPATINIAPSPNFEQSILTVNKTEAPAGSSLRYDITVSNTGSTVAEIEILNSLPEEVIYIEGGLSSNSDLLALEYDGILHRIRAVATIPTQNKISFSFVVRIEPELKTGHIIINTATVRDLNIVDSSFPLQAETTINNQLQLSPELAQLYPLPNAKGVSLDADVDLEFNVALDIKSFEFQVSFAYYNKNISGWTIQWHDGNTRATLKPPGRLAVGATYVIAIINAQDEAGNVLADAAFSSTWSFTTVSPSITISGLEDSLMMMQQGTQSDPIVVELIDAITGDAYTTPDDIYIKINKTSLTGQIMLDEAALRPASRITIAANASRATFYYTDTRCSLPNHVTLTLFEEPSQGFPDTMLPIVVTDTPIEETLSDKLGLIITSYEIDGLGSFSSPLVVSAYSVYGASIPLPDILYFYTQSPTGLFYDGSLNVLPTGVTVQSSETQINSQHFKSSHPLHSAVFYYRDTNPSSSIITISDNPLLAQPAGDVITAPDIGYRNINAVLSVLEIIQTIQRQPATANLAGITAVNDNSGRVLDYIKILPTSTQMLPSESKVFYAQGYDNTGRAIESLVFKWYTPSDGGTIDADDADKVVFTANTTIGTFYDAAMVVALYNGTVKYATTDITITDIVEYEQPTRLPVSGWNGLQLIFMALTLVAAILLAWVEHYDKTHFKHKN